VYDVPETAVVALATKTSAVLLVIEATVPIVSPLFLKYITCYKFCSERCPYTSNSSARETGSYRSSPSL